MIDINLIRENAELVKENIKKKFQDEKLVLVDEVKAFDEEWYQEWCPWYGRKKAAHYGHTRF